MESTVKEHQRLHLLVVEDETDLHFGIQETLKDDFDMFFVSTAEDAIAYIDKTQKIDRLLTDFNLKGEKNGADVIRAMRMKFKNTPIVLMSGNPPEIPAISSVISTEKVNFLQKPFTNKKLSEVILNAHLRK